MTHSATSPKLSIADPILVKTPALLNLGKTQSAEQSLGTYVGSTSRMKKSPPLSDSEWNERLLQVDEDCGILAVLLMMSLEEQH